MTSRLDRLFILLETGSTAATRQAAAKQIGEVQKLYPHELHALLNRLVGYLHSTSWETRIAAAQTVEAILKQVPPWQPELQVLPKKERCATNTATAAAAAEEDSCQSSGSNSTTASERLLSLMSSICSKSSTKVPDSSAPRATSLMCRRSNRLVAAGRRTEA